MASQLKRVVSDSTAAGGFPFADRLEVTITSGTDTVYSGPLTGMSLEDAGTIAPGASKTYDFSVHFLDGGSGGADNVYKGATVTVGYDWEAVNN